MLFCEVLSWPLTRLMGIPEWTDLAHTETNSWFKTSILWSSLFKNDIVLLEKSLGLLSQTLWCTSSGSFFVSFEDGSDPMKMKLNNGQKIVRSLYGELKCREKHEFIYWGLGKDTVSKTWYCFCQYQTATVDAYIYIYRKYQKVRTTKHSQAKLLRNCFLHELALSKQIKISPWK